MKKFTGPILRTPRSPRSNDLKLQNDENSKWKLVKTRWNPKFGLGDLKNDLLTSTTSEWAQWIFSKITFLKSVHSKEKNEACLGFLEEIFTKSVHRGGVCSRASKAPFSTALTRESKIGEWWNYNQVFLGCALVGAAFSQYFRPSVCLS